jgi:hypothetical protein
VVRAARGGRRRRRRWREGPARRIGMLRLLHCEAGAAQPPLRLPRCRCRPVRARVCPSPGGWRRKEGWWIGRHAGCCCCCCCRVSWCFRVWFGF